MSSTPGSATTSTTGSAAQTTGSAAEFAEGWELVVGLEVHVELATVTKLFCSCANRFSVEPNSDVCEVCLGLPGSLPVMNAKAVEFAMRLGRALQCDVNPAVMARKNYFYPDMAKDYQITQYDRPTCTDGRVLLDDGTQVRIERAHIEEDAAKIVHSGGDGRINAAAYALVDYNRAGVPLVEIVTRPDIRSVAAARACVKELRAVLTAIRVSDAKMEEGSLRVDANVSVRPSGSAGLRKRCEIKNINSLRSLSRAIDYEARRQIDLYAGGEAPRQETRHWDEAAGRSTPGRSKEDADDYRYLREPDLAPLTPAVDDLAAIDASLPLLPAARRSRLAELSSAAGDVLSSLVERGQDDLAVAVIAAGADPDKALVRIQNDLAVSDWSKVTPDGLAALLAMESAGDLSATQARQILADMVEQGGEPAALAAARGFEAMADDELEALLDRIIADHRGEWERFVLGDDADRKKMQGFFTGQVMRATKGQADGRAVAESLARRSGA